MIDYEDQAVMDAAGIIMWHLERRHPFARAVAAAQEAQPGLSDSEIGFAAQWAQSAVLFGDMVNRAAPHESICQLAYMAGLPCFED